MPAECPSHPRFQRSIFLAQVADNMPLCREHFRLCLRVDGFPPALPGQFIQILCADAAAELWSGGVHIRRPFSIGGLRRTGPSCELDILYRVIGPGTAWMAGRRPGDTVNILGPLGRPFVVAPDRPQALLVGGGIGLPPLIWLAETLTAAGKQALAVVGARTADLLPLRRDPAQGSVPWVPDMTCLDFAAHGIAALIATDDGSLGTAGRVPDVLAGYLRRHPPSAKDIMVYCCGPEGMIAAVAELCHRMGLSCQVCLERVMACGMGTCQSCVVRVRDERDPEGWTYALCCTDGPVFDSRQVIWSV